MLREDSPPQLIEFERTLGELVGPREETVSEIASVIEVQGPGKAANSLELLARIGWTSLNNDRVKTSNIIHSHLT